MTVPLSARDLAFGYRGRRVGAVAALDLAAGRTLALLGPNGGGKTTLLKTLIGLLPPLAGEVRLGGDPLSALGAAERARRIAYVPQAGTAAFGFSARDVVLMGRAAHHGPFARPGPADEAAAAAALDRLGIAHLGPRPITAISGGERQLVLIARALAQGAGIVVLDEPTASLDFGNQGRVLAELGRLAASNLAVLFTTHDPNQALRHADEVALLRDGGLQAAGPARAILTREALAQLYASPVEEVGSGTERAFLPG